MAVFYFGTPLFIYYYKLRKDDLSLMILPFWLFIVFPIISTFFAHDCVQGEPDEDTDLYYTGDNIWKMHTFRKVDEDVE